MVSRPAIWAFDSPSPRQESTSRTRRVSASRIAGSGASAERTGVGPPPVKPPRYGTARARHEGRLWLRTALAAAVAVVLLQLAIRYVGDAGSTDSLTAWQLNALRTAGIHGVIALTYTLWPKKPPADGEHTRVERPPSVSTT